MSYSSYALGTRGLSPDWINCVRKGRARGRMALGNKFRSIPENLKVLINESTFLYKKLGSGHNTKNSLN